MKLFPVAAFCLVLIEYYDVIKCYSQIKQFYDIILVCIFLQPLKSSPIPNTCFIEYLLTPFSLIDLILSF